MAPPEPAPIVRIACGSSQTFNSAPIVVSGNVELEVPVTDAQLCGACKDKLLNEKEPHISFANVECGPRKCPDGRSGSGCYTDVTITNMPKFGVGDITCGRIITFDNKKSGTSQTQTRFVSCSATVKGASGSMQCSPLHCNTPTPSPSPKVTPNANPTAATTKAPTPAAYSLILRKGIGS